MPKRCALAEPHRRRLTPSLNRTKRDPTRSILDRIERESLTGRSRVQTRKLERKVPIKDLGQTTFPGPREVWKLSILGSRSRRDLDEGRRSIQPTTSDETSKCACRTRRCASLCSNKRFERTSEEGGMDLHEPYVQAACRKREEMVCDRRSEGDEKRHQAVPQQSKRTRRRRVPSG